jgi:hypothetical protein
MINQNIINTENQKNMGNIIKQSNFGSFQQDNIAI